MKKIFILLAMLATLEARDTKLVANTHNAKTICVIGEAEMVFVSEANITKAARIDTGATITSVDARDIQAFDKDGKEWVRFKFADKPIELELHGKKEIKRHQASPITRNTVLMNIKMGNVTKKIEVTLANREQFEYPVLIGRNFLVNSFVVDVSSSYLADKNIKIIRTK